MLGLPADVIVCLFDLDGVVTNTASVHAKAWKDMFDTFLAERAKQTGETFVPFSSSDYDRFVDGRPRLDGTRTFLRARHIDLAEGSPDDPPDAVTVYGLSNHKNDLVLARLAAGGVEVYPGSVSYIRSAKKNGIKTAIVSSSANTKQVLDGVGLSGLFDVRIDGVVASERGLAGKPAPDTFLAAAAALYAEPGQAAVFEDALAGVEAGRAGGFALVVGVDRVGQATQLHEHGADIVVRDLAELMDEQ